MQIKHEVLEGIFVTENSGRVLESLFEVGSGEKCSPFESVCTGFVHVAQGRSPKHEKYFPLKVFHRRIVAEYGFLDACFAIS